MIEKMSKGDQASLPNLMESGLEPIAKIDRHIA
jgi:hypothetical protein